MKRSRSAGVVGPGAGAEAEAAVVGEADGFVDVFHAEQRRDGAEKFFAIGGRFFRDVGENGGRVVVAGTLEGWPPVSSLRAGFDGFLHVGVERLDGVGGGERAEFSVLVEGIADAQVLHAVDELRFELGGDGFGDDEALGGDAGLAVVDDAGLHGGGDGGVEIGAGHDDERIAAAEFEHNFLDALGGRDSDFDAGLLAAGERGGDHARIVQDGVDLLRADEQGLKSACGESGFEENLFNCEGALRHVGGVLEQSDVAGHQRGSGEAKHLPEGEVPRHDGENGADGAIADEAFLAPVSMTSSARMCSAFSA